MRLLAIDYGEKRIGIAISDPLGLTAQPFEVVENNKSAISRIKQICEEKEVTKIIIGLPTTLGGKESFAVDKVRSFCLKLKGNVSVPIEEYDERFTTSIAQKTMIAGDASRQTRKGSIDKIAAAVMLREYMDRVKPQ